MVDDDDDLDASTEAVAWVNADADAAGGDLTSWANETVLRIERMVCTSSSLASSNASPSWLWLAACDRCLQRWGKVGGGRLTLEVGGSSERLWVCVWGGGLGVGGDGKS